MGDSARFGFDTREPDGGHPDQKPNCLSLVYRYGLWADNNPRGFEIQKAPAAELIDCGDPPRDSPFSQPLLSGSRVRGPIACDRVKTFAMKPECFIHFQTKFHEVLLRRPREHNLSRSRQNIRNQCFAPECTRATGGDCSARPGHREGFAFRVEPRHGVGDNFVRF